MAGISSSSDLRDTHSSQKSSDNRLDSWYASWLSKLISVELSEDRLFDAFGDYSVQEITGSVEEFFVSNKVAPLLEDFTKSQLRQLGLPHDQPNKDKEVLMALFEIISDAEGLNAVCNAAIKGTLAESTKFNNWINDKAGDREEKEMRIILTIINFNKTLHEIDREKSDFNWFVQKRSFGLSFRRKLGYLRELRERCVLLLKILEGLSSSVVPDHPLFDIISSKYSKVLEFGKFIQTELQPAIDELLNQLDELKVFAVGLGNCQAAKYTVKIGGIDHKVVVMYDCGSTTGSENAALYETNNSCTMQSEYMADVKAFLDGTTYTFLILSHPDKDHYNKVIDLFGPYTEGEGRLFTILCGEFKAKEKKEQEEAEKEKEKNEKTKENQQKEEATQLSKVIDLVKRDGEMHLEMYLNHASFKSGTLSEAMNLFRNNEYEYFEAFKTAAKQIGPKVNFLAVNHAVITTDKNKPGTGKETSKEGGKDQNQDSSAGKSAEKKEGTDVKVQNKASPIVSLTVTNDCNTFSLVCTGDAEEVSLGDMSSLQNMNSSLEELERLYSGNIEEVHSQAQRFCHLEKHSHYTALMAPHHGSNNQRDVCKLLIDAFKPNHVLVCGSMGSSGFFPHFKFLKDTEEKLASTTDVRNLFVVNYYFEGVSAKGMKDRQHSGSTFDIIDVNTYGTATINGGMLSCRGTPRVLTTGIEIPRIRKVKDEKTAILQPTINIDLEMVTASNSTKCITTSEQSISGPNDLFPTSVPSIRELQYGVSALSVR
eukprot:TRINITY_DN377_c0_g1_i2.p1 TRINITY_DN377_c0_g1~~TRINITY_DN377_c0_g1_i2.p1  ORF type:complete len:766 (+),score=93.15 TRINITY_DN377_c0_g1_i2:90-2387(+)